MQLSIRRFVSLAIAASLAAAPALADPGKGKGEGKREKHADEVEVIHYQVNHGPPPWAPAHGYRRKHDNGRPVYVAPFSEDDLGGLRSHMPVERILFGSDYPHPEGAAQPLDYLDDYRDYTPDEVEKVFSRNLKALLEGRAE